MTRIPPSGPAGPFGHHEPEPENKRRKYARDISQEKFEEIEPLLRARSRLIVDAQSVKNTDTAAHKGL